MFTSSSIPHPLLCTLAAVFGRSAAIGLCLLLVLPGVVDAGESADVLRVTGFDVHKVEIQGAVDVEISQGATAELLLRGAPASLSPEPFHVRGQTLVLGTPAGSAQVSSGVAFKLTLPALESVLIAGSGDVFIRPLDTATFTLRVDGSGDAHLYALRAEKVRIDMRGAGDVQVAELVVQQLRLRLSGAGDIQLGPLQAESLEAVVNGAGDIVAGEGRSAAVSVTVVGSGDVSFAGLEIDEAEVSVIGSGGIRLGPTSRLRATIMGSGDISYTGEPEIDQNVIGSGQLQQE